MIVAAPSYTVAAARIWLAKPKLDPEKNGLQMQSKFPPKWHLLCGVKFTHGSGGVETWNANHFLVRLIDKKSWEWCGSVFNKSLNPLPHRAELFEDPGRAAAWVLRCISNEEKELWNGLADQDPSFLEELWKYVVQSSGQKTEKMVDSIGRWIDGPGSSYLFLLKPEACLILKNDKEIVRYMPDPGEKWTLTIQDDERSRFNIYEMLAMSKKISRTRRKK